MANSNVNIAKKLFAYIQHKADLTQEMVDMYNNSLIFLGDEKQIFVPVMNTYVGVGMSSYNTIIDELNRISSNMTNINSSLNKNTVTKIYSQIDKSEDTSQIGVEPYYLNNEITVKGIDSYVWANGEAVANEPNSRNITRNVYSITTDVEHGGISATTVAFKEKVNLTDTFAGGSYSGISVTSESAGLVDTGETDDNGNKIYVQGRNVLKIDDSITWAYITAKNAEISDDYKRYTNDEINRIYQTIVGTDKNGECYVPVSFTQIQLDKDSAAKYYYKTISDAGGASWSSPMTAATILETPWTNEGEDVPGDAPQFYMRVTSANAYNLGDKDIRNGLNTLKEVAYVLDVLTDGIEGDVTYVTKTAYEADRSNPERKYHLVTENSGPENYAYYVSINSENLGIRMAYSIYGNQVQIDELRDHIKAIETGDTTLRSIDSDTNSQYASLEISTQNNHHGALDFNAGKPFENESELQGNSNVAYFGDATVKLNLNTTEVYVKTKNVPTTGTPGTSDTVIYPAEAAVVLNGVKTIGVYQKADNNNLDPASVDYYSATTSNGAITLTKLSAADAAATIGELYFVDEDSVQGDTVLYEWSKDNKSDVYILNHQDKIYGSKDNNDNWTIYQTAQAAAAAAAGDTANNIPKVNVYQVTDETATLTAKLFAKVPAEGVEEDKVATSAWVLSLVGDATDNPSSGSGTAEEVDLSSLKYEHAYGDFESLFWDNAIAEKAGLTEGTAAYQAKYDEYYDVFKNGTATESGNNVVLSKDGKTITLTKEAYYASNRFNKASHVLDIVNQENGKVSATSRELPSDEIVAKANIWGEEESSNPKGYTAIPSSVYTSGDIIANLFAFNKDNESEVFIIDNTNTTYKEIPAIIEEANFPTGDKYWYNTVTNTYSLLSGIGTDEPYSSWSDYTTKQGWLRWRPIYVATPKYVNLDLNSATIENGVLHLKDITGADHAIANDTVLYYANTKPAAEVKYLTTESKHFDYAHGGTGENRLEVTANIVKLEDASATNTGFADAFDVKSYIDNLIEWVNLSASVSNADLANPVFYEVVPANANVTTANYKKVVNDNIVTMTNLTAEEADEANSSTSSWKANGRWISGHEVYTRVQNVVENPLNLTTTRLVTSN